MSMVDVTVLRRDGQIVWQQSVDRDSAYFQDFLRNAKAELSAGWSITITPEEDLVDSGVIRAQWDEKNRKQPQ